ncbi:ElaB protein [Pararobbsia alpina]
MTDQSIQLQLGRQKIAEDLRTLIADTEELLRLTASASGEQIDVLRSRLRERLDEAKTALAEASSVARGKYRVAADNADQYVRDNPWQAVGVGVGVGILLGVLAAR